MTNLSEPDGPITRADALVGAVSRFNRAVNVFRKAETEAMALGSAADSHYDAAMASEERYQVGVANAATAQSEARAMADELISETNSYKHSRLSRNPFSPRTWGRRVARWLDS